MGLAERTTRERKALCEKLENFYEKHKDRPIWTKKMIEYNAEQFRKVENGRTLVSLEDTNGVTHHGINLGYPFNAEQLSELTENKSIELLFDIRHEYFGAINLKNEFNAEQSAKGKANFIVSLMDIDGEIHEGINLHVLFANW